MWRKPEHARWSHVWSVRPLWRRRASPTPRLALRSRHRREGALRLADLRQVVRELDAEWGSFSVVEVSDAVVRRAGALAERHALRGYDAVHLAAAVDLRRAGGDVEFAAFDARLCRAARREGLAVPPL